jgi:AraC-like DNA-binding protein
MPPVKLSTSLPREEAWALDDIAQQFGLRRSHVMRAMLRFVMATQVEEFVQWFTEQRATAQSPDDPTPTPEPTS